jgi:hypothetical protein
LLEQAPDQKMGPEQRQAPYQSPEQEVPAQKKVPEWAPEQEVPEQATE